MKKSLVLGLGSNLGNRYSYIYQAIRLLAAKFNAEIKAANIYQTAPWGNTNQARFLNTAVSLETDLNSAACFKIIKEIEQEVGRKNSERWGPRSIDIDILFLGDEVSDQNDVIVPHPRIAERSFVLTPALDLHPNFIHPTLNKSLLELSKDIENDCQLFANQIFT